MAVSPDPTIGAALFVQRNARTQPPFSDSELRGLARLGRHVEQALRLGIRLLDAEAAKSGFSDIYERLDIGIFALDSDGRVVFTNAAAMRLVGRGILIRESRLSVARSEERTALEAQIRLMSAAMPRDVAQEPKPILVHREGDERPLALYVLPCNSLSQRPEFLPFTSAIVLAINPESGEPADAAVLRDVLELTLGEARLAALVATGLQPRTAAARLGITEESARTILKRVFSKTGTSRQSELAALVHKLMLLP